MTALVSVPPDPACEWCVVIPARNEEAGVGAALEALANQRETDTTTARPLDRRRYEIILLANNCTDRTAEVARRAGQRWPGLRLHVVERAIPAADAHVGTARRLLMDEAHRRLAGLLHRPGGIIATTDADTLVAPDWLAATAAAVAAGAGAVGGLIHSCRLGRRTLPPGARRLARQDAIYQVLADYLEHLLDPDPADPWPRHHHHFGGSLALTAADYARVGGLPPLPALEDVALVRALRRHDVPLRHSPAVRVWTSARCDGRTPHGLAATLRRWTEATREDGERPDPLGVETPDALVTRVMLRRTLRELWQTFRTDDRFRPDPDRLRRAARELRLSPATVLSVLAEPALPFGMVHERLLSLGPPEVAQLARTSVATAIPELRARVRTILEADATGEDDRDAIAA